MAYRFKLEEPFARDFRRIGLAQIERAGRELARGAERARAVHETRKALKRIRALLRLMRPALDADAFRRENARFRDMGHRLAGEREFDVLVETIVKLEALPRAKRHLGTLATLKDEVAAARARHAGGGDETTTKEALTLLAQAKQEFAGLEPRGHGFSLIGKGLARSYRNGRRASKPPTRSRATRPSTSLRKAVQLHWRHMSLLARAWPDLLEARVAAAKQLSQVLGDDHDLAVLVGFVEGWRRELAPADAAAVVRLARVRQQELRAAARPQLARLYAEGKRGFVRRLALYWAAAQSAAREANARGQPSNLRGRRGSARGAVTRSGSASPRRSDTIAGALNHRPPAHEVLVLPMNELLARDDLVTAGSDHRPADHPAVAHGRIGVLLLNLGTPDATSYWPMRRYLKQFLSDRRVIEEPRWKWWPILNLIILTTRPGRKGKDYETIWNKARDEGPLKTITRNQAEELARRLADKPRVLVDWAMRYANPSTDSRIRALQEQGCERLLLVPLYPQYAAATTATACDEAFRALMKLRWQPAVRVAPVYFDDPAYIERAGRVHAQEPRRARLRAGAHHRHLPRHAGEVSAPGDPYHCQCQKTSRLLRERARLARRALAHDVPVALRHRSLAAALYRRDRRPARARGGQAPRPRRPGFSADCLETLEELDRENREIFVHGGGEKFAYLPALNDSEEGVRVIEGVVRRELQGWA